METAKSGWSTRRADNSKRKKPTHTLLSTWTYVTNERFHELGNRLPKCSGEIVQRTKHRKKLPNTLLIYLTKSKTSLLTPIRKRTKAKTKEMVTCFFPVSVCCQNEKDFRQKQTVPKIPSNHLASKQSRRFNSWRLEKLKEACIEKSTVLNCHHRMIEIRALHNYWCNYRYFHAAPIPSITT